MAHKRARCNDAHLMDGNQATDPIPTIEGACNRGIVKPGGGTPCVAHYTCAARVQADLRVATPKRKTDGHQTLRHPNERREKEAPE